MPFKKPELPYELDALQPHISRETLEYHFGKHHCGYVDKLNKATAGTEWADAQLTDVIRGATGSIFNNAAQVWNHSFYWQSMSPVGGGDPDGKLAAAISDGFSSVEQFREQFNSAATGIFGSGWAWLVQRRDGTLTIEQTSNAGCPLTGQNTPLLTCDVWEHAYYIDYRNARARYMEAFWRVVNWDHAASGLK